MKSARKLRCVIVLYVNFSKFHLSYLIKILFCAIAQFCHHCWYSCWSLFSIPVVHYLPCVPQYQCQAPGVTSYGLCSKAFLWRCHLQIQISNVGHIAMRRHDRHWFHFGSGKSIGYIIYIYHHMFISMGKTTSCIITAAGFGRQVEMGWRYQFGVYICLLHGSLWNVERLYLGAPLLVFSFPQALA